MTRSISKGFYKKKLLLLYWVVSKKMTTYSIIVQHLDTLYSPNLCLYNGHCLRKMHSCKKRITVTLFGSLIKLN